MSTLKLVHVIPTEVSASDTESLRYNLEAARTRVKFYGETLTLSWLEDLIEQTYYLDGQLEKIREQAYEDGYELGERHAVCEQAYEDGYELGERQAVCDECTKRERAKEKKAKV